LSLPGEFDGSKAVARMQRLDPKLKAIVSSGYDHDPIMRRYRDYGFNAAIAKPFELNQLTRIVREVLNANGATRKSA
jgi:DNA-binding NarL/FixJ family response regulator